MRKILIVCLIGVLPCLLRAQSVKEEIFTDINKAGGLNYVYDYKEDPSVTRAPKGYRPFYISHWGRHGARYQFSYYDSVEVWLGRASARSILTLYGEEFLEKLTAFHKKAHFKESDLTPIGKDQHRMIASRMYRNYKDVFKGNTRVWAVATTSPRVMLSMLSFVETLKELDGKMEASCDASLSYYPFLNPASKSNPAYVNRPRTTKETDRAISAFFNENVAWKGIYGRFFTDIDAAAELGVKPSKLIESLHFITSGMQCLDHDRGLFDGTFTPEEEYGIFRYRAMKEAAFLANYSKSVSTFYKYSAYAIRHFIETADSDMESGEYNVRLRFCHDSNIMPLLNLLNIDGMGREITSLEDAEDIFPLYRIPMGASIQFIFFRSRKNPEVLVKVLLNEREASLPFEPVTGPYYSWNDFKEYYGPRMESLIQSLEAENAKGKN